MVSKRKLDEMTEKLKERGSKHYKTGQTEPIDLMRDGAMLWDFALCSIIKYAFRSRRANSLTDSVFIVPDMEKIKHYADMVIGMVEAKTKEKKKGG